MNLSTELVWYYVDLAGATAGPVSAVDLRKKVFWNENLLIYREGIADWAAYGDLLLAKDPYLIGVPSVTVPLPPGQRPLFYSIDGNAVEGPVDPQTLHGLIARGELPASVQVCEVNSEKWVAFNQRPHTSPPPSSVAAQPRPAPSQADGCAVGCMAIAAIIVFLFVLGSCGRFIIHF